MKHKAFYLLAMILVGAVAVIGCGRSASDTEDAVEKFMVARRNMFAELVTAIEPVKSVEDAEAAEPKIAAAIDDFIASMVKLKIGNAFLTDAERDSLQSAMDSAGEESRDE